MKLLFFGDAAQTGFGTVSRELGQRFLAAGMDVRFIYQNMTHEPPPFAERAYDAARLDQNALSAMLTKGARDGWKPDKVLMLFDAHAAERLVVQLGIQDAFETLPVYHHVPIEGVDLPIVPWRAFWSHTKPIAITAFGATEIERIVGHSVPFVHHGVDRTTFRPVTERPIEYNGRLIHTKREAKVALTFDPDAIIVLRTDRFMPRKRFDTMLRGMALAMMADPRIHLVLHCAPHDMGGRLESLISKMPAELNGRIVLTHGHNTWFGLSPEHLALLYNAADIYLSNGAEGFGLCLAEALACGTPVIGLDYAATPELVGDAGVLLPVAGLVANEYDYYWADADPQEIGRAVMDLAADDENRQLLAERGPARMSALFSWDDAGRKMVEILGQDEGELDKEANRAGLLQRDRLSQPDHQPKDRQRSRGKAARRRHPDGQSQGSVARIRPIAPASHE